MAMKRISVAIRKTAIFCHRWMGVAFSVLFMWWFVSGIVMMYWTYPEVTQRDRLQRAPYLDASQVRFTPEEAYKAVDPEGSPASVRLATFDGRPAYFFRSGGPGGGLATVYADTGQQQDIFPDDMNLRTAANWARRPASEAKVEELNDSDQWTLLGAFRNLRPLYKYSFPDGQQVYISANTGEVEQHTTTSSRIYAYLGVIPHWLYFTPLRKNGPLWSKVVIWSSGIATVAALMGLVVGLLMYSPSKRYRYLGAPTSIPYTGQKRLHTLLGLFVGILACTWAFSGMLSMDPFPIPSGGPAGVRGKQKGPDARIAAALSGGRFQVDAFAALTPQAALMKLGDFKAKELSLTRVAGEPAYIAIAEPGVTRIVPVAGAPQKEIDQERLMQMVQAAAGAENLAELRWLDQYDAYYLDRTRQKPLPVLLATLKPGGARLYVDPKSGRVVGRYAADTASWVNRWLYHGLHSLDFPWLYNHRPAWDIVVLGLMLACTWLCWTSLVLTWRVLKRKVAPPKARKMPTEDLAMIE